MLAARWRMARRANERRGQLGGSAEADVDSRLPSTSRPPVNATQHQPATHIHLPYYQISTTLILFQRKGQVDLTLLPG